MQFVKINNYSKVLLLTVLALGMIFSIQPVRAQVTTVSPGSNVPSVSGAESVIATLRLPAIGGQDAILSPDTKKQLIEQQQDAVIADVQEAGAINNIEKATNIPVVSFVANEAAQAALANDSRVVAIQKNRLNKTSLSASVAQINADTLHANGTSGSGQAVAILDTGSDVDHEFLNVISEACYSNSGGFGGGTSVCPGGVTSSTASGSGDECIAIDGCDHGTHVAGIASGNKTTTPTLAGAAPESDTIAIQVFTEYSAAQCGTPEPCLSASDFDIIQGLDRVLELQNDPSFAANIAAVNLSLGGGLYNSQATCDADNSATKASIDALKIAGVATIIASGNDGNSTRITAPGCISSAIAIGSINDSGAISSFSNSNSLVDLVAPGGSIYSSVPGNSYATFAGTSMAAPHVAGAIAVLAEKYPNATVDELATALISEGPLVTDTRNNQDFPATDVVAAANAETLNQSQIIVTATNNITTETGETATIQFSLASEPTDPVTIPVEVSDTTEASIGPVTSITITAATWNVPESNEIIVTGVDDSAKDGRITYAFVTGDPASDDALYGDLGDTDTEDIVLYNLEETGQDESLFIKKSDTRSGKIELYEWSADSTSWEDKIITHTASRALSDANTIRIEYGDTNGDGVDTPHFIKLADTRSGRIEVYTWNTTFTDWESKTITHVAQRTDRTAPTVRTLFADTDGDGTDELHFIKVAAATSNRVEFYTWNSALTGWDSSSVSFTGARPVADAQTVDIAYSPSPENGLESPYFIKLIDAASNRIEIYRWDETLSSWSEKIITHTADRSPSEASTIEIQFKTTNNNEHTAHFNKLVDARSGRIESYSWNSDYSNWGATTITHVSDRSEAASQGVTTPFADIDGVGVDSGP